MKGIYVKKFEDTYTVLILQDKEAILLPVKDSQPTQTEVHPLSDKEALLTRLKDQPILTGYGIQPRMTKLLAEDTEDEERSIEYIDLQYMLKRLLPNNPELKTLAGYAKALGINQEDPAYIVHELYELIKRVSKERNLETTVLSTAAPKVKSPLKAEDLKGMEPKAEPEAEPKAEPKAEAKAEAKAEPEITEEVKPVPETTWNKETVMNELHDIFQKAENTLWTKWIATAVNTATEENFEEVLRHGAATLTGDYLKDFYLYTYKECGSGELPEEFQGLPLRIHIIARLYFLVLEFDKSKLYQELAAGLSAEYLDSGKYPEYNEAIDVLKHTLDSQWLNLLEPILGKVEPKAAEIPNFFKEERVFKDTELETQTPAPEPEPVYETIFTTPVEQSIFTSDEEMQAVIQQVTTQPPAAETAADDFEENVFTENNAPWMQYPTPVLETDTSIMQEEKKADSNYQLVQEPPKSGKKTSRILTVIIVILILIVGALGYGSYSLYKENKTLKKDLSESHQITDESHTVEVNNLKLMLDNKAAEIEEYKEQEEAFRGRITQAYKEGNFQKVVDLIEGYYGEDIPENLEPGYNRAKKNVEQLQEQ